MYLALRQSIKLLIIECQKGHTSYEEREHFLVFKKVEGHRAPVPPLFRGPCVENLYGFQKNIYKPLESQPLLFVSNKNSGRSSGGNGSEVQEVVGGPGLAKDGETLGPKREYKIGTCYLISSTTLDCQTCFALACYKLFQQVLTSLQMTGC